MYKEKLIEWVLSALAAVIAFFSPIVPLIGIVAALVFFDTTLGTKVAKKNLEPVVNKWDRAFAKFISFFVAILISYGIQRFLMPDFPAAKIVTIIIAGKELASIDKNYKKINGYSIFAFLTDKLNSEIKK